MKKAFFTLAFVIAIAFAFAFKPTPPPIPAHYKSGAACPSDQTNESGCIVGGAHAQCTVAVAGNPPAFNLSNCTQPLNLP